MCENLLWGNCDANTLVLSFFLKRACPKGHQRPLDGGQTMQERRVPTLASNTPGPREVTNELALKASSVVVKVNEARKSGQKDSFPVPHLVKG